MQDLTLGSIARHLSTMAAPIAAGMLLQTLYYIVDVYFVAQLGGAPIAGVSATSPVMFVFALTQILGVGTVALMSHAVGRKDRADANHVFNQSVALAALCAAATLAGGFPAPDPFMRTLGADEPTVAAGVTYLRCRRRQLRARSWRCSRSSAGGGARGSSAPSPPTRP